MPHSVDASNFCVVGEFCLKFANGVQQTQIGRGHVISIPQTLLLGILSIFGHCWFSLLQDWVHSLKPYCQNTQAKKHPSISSALKEQRSLLIYICDAHRLPLRQVPHPYCVLSLNNVKVGRTQVGEGTDPIWSEEFILE